MYMVVMHTFVQYLCWWNRLSSLSRLHLIIMLYHIFNLMHNDKITLMLISYLSYHITQTHIFFSCMAYEAC